MAKTQAKNELHWLSGFLSEHSVEVSGVTLCSMYDGLHDHFYKEPIRTDIEVLQDHLDRIEGMIKNLQPNDKIHDLNAVMESVGLDPSIRSDRYKVRKFLMENDLLTYQPTYRKEAWTRLLNGPANGNGAVPATDDQTDAAD